MIDISCYSSTDRGPHFSRLPLPPHIIHESTCAPPTLPPLPPHPPNNLSSVHQHHLPLHPASIMSTLRRKPSYPTLPPTHPRPLFRRQPFRGHRAEQEVLPPQFADMLTCLAAGSCGLKRVRICGEGALLRENSNAPFFLTERDCFTQKSKKAQFFFFIFLLSHSRRQGWATPVLEGLLSSVEV